MGQKLKAMYGKNHAMYVPSALECRALSTNRHLSRNAEPHLGSAHDINAGMHSNLVAEELHYLDAKFHR